MLFDHAPARTASSRQIKAFFTDREYYRQLVVFALPLALQNLVISSLNMVGVVMIGQLGETPVAAVGLAAQIFFLLQLVLFGINSGASMFTAQLWGKLDLPNIRKVLALAILLGLIAGSVFLGLAWLAPQAVLGIYSEDPQVVALGSEYLRIFGWAYIFFPVTFSFSMVMRSIGDVKTPMLVSTGALAFNALLSYLLIFGKLGLPALGVRGAAIAAPAGAPAGMRRAAVDRLPPPLAHRPAPERPGRAGPVVYRTRLQADAAGDPERDLLVLRHHRL